MSEYAAAAAHMERQHLTDLIPCPSCGGDRLRGDYSDSVTCHVAFPREVPSGEVGA